MKKQIIAAVLVLLLTTTTLLFANSEKSDEEIPAGSIKTEAEQRETEESPTKPESPAKPIRELQLNKAQFFPESYGIILIEDDRGDYRTHQDLLQDYALREKDETEVGEIDPPEAEKAEEKTGESEMTAAIKEKETEPGASPASVTAREVKEDKEDHKEDKNSTAIALSSSSTSSSTESTSSTSSTAADSSESTEVIPTAAPTPPRSPNVPSYSMDRIGIYHNDQGAVTVVYPNAPQKRLRVLVEKGSERSAYNLHDGTGVGNAVATYPLQRGDGTYLVRIMENTGGNSYREVYRQEVTLKSQQKHAVYLNSIQEINWSASDPAIQKAAQLTAGMSSDREKVNAVYNYIVRNVAYDHDKVNQVNTFYLPSINSTFSSNKGICYDYASLFAAMLRSQGIPTRMVKGYSAAIGNGEVYHAWNEVYLASEDRWIIIDTTHDAPHVQQGRSVDMIKNSGGFRVTHRL